MQIMSYGRLKMIIIVFVFNEVLSLYNQYIMHGEQKYEGNLWFSRGVNFFF